eukprot:scaffold167648_cov22-Prasinocladus_malaysianus.AAC.1
MVEVSCDGGESWHQAEPEQGENGLGGGGSTLWEVEIQGLPAKTLERVHEHADKEVLARATDDSLNLAEARARRHAGVHREL